MSLPLLLDDRDSSSEADAAPAENKAVQQELESKVRSWVDACNDRELPNPMLDLITEDFVSDFDSYGEMRASEVSREFESRRQLNSTTASSAKVFKVAIEDIWVVIGPTAWTASVFLQADVQGLPAPKLVSKGINEFKWRRRGGKWMCYRHTLMRNLCDTVAEAETVKGRR